jgi:hypothetical protein
MVPRDHHHADAGGMAPRHRIGNPGAQRVGQPGQAQQEKR